MATKLLDRLSPTCSCIFYTLSTFNIHALSRPLHLHIGYVVEMNVFLLTFNYSFTRRHTLSHTCPLGDIHSDHLRS